MNKEDAILLSQFNANQAEIAEQEIIRLRKQRDKVLAVLKNWSDPTDCGCDTASCQGNCLPAVTRAVISEVEREP